MPWNMNGRMTRFLSSIAVFLAGGVVVLELQPPAVVDTPPPAVVRSEPLTQAVPASWAQFAQLVQDQFKARLEADNAIADRFRAFLKTQARGASPVNFLLVQVWVGADGKVARIDCPPLQDQQAIADLHAILEQRAIGRPPPDMPQPLRVKLALDLQTGA
jgi:hypothetical protein